MKLSRLLPLLVLPFAACNQKKETPACIETPGKHSHEAAEKRELAALKEASETAGRAMAERDEAANEAARQDLRRLHAENPSMSNLITKWAQDAMQEVSAKRLEARLQEIDRQAAERKAASSRK